MKEKSCDGEPVMVKAKDETVTNDRVKKKVMKNVNRDLIYA